MEIKMSTASRRIKKLTFVEENIKGSRKRKFKFLEIRFYRTLEN